MTTIKTNVLPVNLQNLVAKTGLKARTVRFSWTDAAFTTYNTGGYGSDKIVCEDNCLKTVDPESRGCYMDDGGDAQNETYTEFHGHTAYLSHPTGGKPYVTVVAVGVKATNAADAIAELNGGVVVDTAPVNKAPKKANAKVLVALDTFLEVMNVETKAYYAKRFPDTDIFDGNGIGVEFGKKYAKILHTGTNKSVFGFIDLTNGDLYKAASWSAPAKHVRGNILGPRAQWGCTANGVNYLR